MKNLKHLSFLLILFALSCDAQSKATLSNQPFDSVATQKIDSIGNELIKTGKALGFSIAIMHKKDTLYAKGFGFRDIKRSKPFTSETIFQIASVTKFITSISVLKLVDKGQLSLSDKLSDILPSYPIKNDGENITIRHLLNHTSGIREYQSLADSLITVPTPNVDSKELFKMFKNLPADFEPGSNFSYSNSGFLLLSLIIEEVSGKSYRDFIKEEVSNPMGLSTLDSWKNNAGNDKAALEFVLADGTFIESKYNDITWLLGDGGLSANSIDLARLPYSVFSEGFLPKSLIDEMLQSPTLKNGAIPDYGLGIRKGKLFNEPVWGHTGGGSTWTNVIAWYPESNISVVVQVNTDRTPVNAIGIESQILPIIFRDRSLGVDSLNLDNKYSQEYEGFFSDSPRFPRQKSTISTYIHSDGNLYRKRKGSESIGQKLIPIAVDTFAPEEHPLDRVVFDRNDMGDVVAMKDYYNGRFMRLRNKEIDQ